MVDVEKRFKSDRWKITTDEVSQDTILFSQQLELELTLSRKLDVITLKESLILRVKRMGSDYEGIDKVCSLVTIERDLLSLREYGYPMLHKDILNARKLIEENYNYIRLVEEAEIDALEPLLVIIAQYIASNDVENRNGYYNIKAADFATVFNDSAYEGMSLTYLRKQLLDRKLTIASAGRTDRTIMIGSVPTKVISFDAKKLNELVTTTNDAEDSQ